MCATLTASPSSETPSIFGCNGPSVTELNGAKPYLDDLSTALSYRALVDKMMLAAVAGARREGASWSTIGTALDVTPQGARSTWARRITAEAKSLVDQPLE